jgi:hypothetical protein
MNAILKRTIDAFSRLPEAQQEELALRFEEMVAHAEIDAKLSRSEAQGGVAPHDSVMAELRRMLATEYAG